MKKGGIWNIKQNFTIWNILKYFGGWHSMNFCTYMLRFAAQILTLEGTIICIKYTLKRDKLCIHLPLKGTIHYEKHTLKRDKKCQKPYPWGLSIGIWQYIVGAYTLITWIAWHQSVKFTKLSKSKLKPPIVKICYIFFNDWKTVKAYSIRATK